MSNFTENLKPATSNSNEAINELSPEEFQRTLLTWFENRGVIADLRAHLRRNMIDILRDTNLGQTVSQKQTTLSPKAQVINLLIIEFLMKHKYHFTLSVFSTEVPFLNILPEYSNSLINATTSIEGANTDKTEINCSFSETNFWDILQTLGFSTESLYSKKLHDLYFNKNNDAFIVSVIKLLATMCNKNVLKNEFKDNVIDKLMLNTDMEPWIKDIYNLLTHFDIPDEVIIQLHDHIKSIFEKEQAKIKTEESTKFNFLHTQIQKDFQSREAEICKMINEMENTFYKEKQKLSGELMKEQEKLNQLTQALAGKQQECENNLLMLTRREENLKYRENEIAEQTEILKSRIKIMQNIYDTIVEENSRIAQIKQQRTTDEVNDQDKLEQTQLQLEYEFLRREIQETKETLKQIHKIIPENNQKDHQSECEEKLLRGLLERVQAENAQLRLLNTQQQIRIDELTVRNTVLMNDLENSQTTINVLTRSRLTNQITVPPLLAPPIQNTRTRSPRIGSLNGGGENLGFVPQHPIQPTYRHLVHSPPPRDSRRKISRRILTSNESSDDSSPSPTEEILREAKLRLRKLEEETESVDRSYRAFKQRQSQLIKDNISFILPTQYTANHFRSVFPSSNREFYKPAQNKERCVRSRPEDLSRYSHIFNTSTDFQIPSTSKCADFLKVTINTTENEELNQERGNMTFVDENLPSTSRGFAKPKEKDVDIKNDNNVDINIRDDYRSSGASSPGLPQFHNLSLSSIEMSTDNQDISDNKPPEKDL